ncbi:MULTISPECIES: M23 family metallopeptidase [Bacteroidales]|uniref:M23 family metallopeptidase n=1 Tax=Bacteroidales TaxID=171549 RepID=UPI00321B9D41
MIKKLFSTFSQFPGILVGKGKQVTSAEPVGITGSTGRSTGEHLHITCKLNGKSIDPRILFRHIKNIKYECVRALRDL